jgi:hypothetical protein
MDALAFKEGKMIVPIGILILGGHFFLTVIKSSLRE